MNPEENVSPMSPVQNFTPVQPVQQQVPQTPPIKIGKFKASKMIFKESWNILKQNKELLWFPVFSGIASLLALVVMVALFFFVVMQGDINAFNNISDVGGEVLTYTTLFVYYVVMFFIANYFMAGVYIIVQGQFNGQNLSLSEGISGANRNIGKIFVWSVISATVGVVLRFISDKSKWLGQLVVWLLGAAWAIMTYFSLPSLVIGQRSVGESFKESAALIRKTWGETIIISFGVGLYFMALVLGIIAVCGIIIILVPVFEMVILVGILFVVAMVGISVVSSTLSSIFKLAIYQYALTGTVPTGFSPDLIKGAIKAGK
ncbi:MAG: DUF6159 family protein [Patescibacteria group bacterium]